MPDQKKLGFVGVGAIANAVIRGLITHGKYTGQIFVSQRNEKKSAQLSTKFATVQVIPDNQQLVSSVDWIFVSVLPNQSRELLAQLEFQPLQKVISLVAGLSLAELKPLVHPAVAIRIIPLPPIEFGLGPLPLCPPDTELEQLFNRFGTSIPVNNENDFQVFSTVSGVMAAHHEFTATIARWVGQQGVAADLAAQYASQLIHSLSGLEIRATSTQLENLSHDCLTDGGLNEQVLRELKQREWFKTLYERLDILMARITSNRV